MPKNQTDPTLKALIQFTQALLLFITVGAAPLAIFQTLTHAIQPSSVFGLYGAILPAWYTILVLLVTLRVITPADMTKAHKVAGFERSLHVAFCSLSALFFALFTFLFFLAMKDTLTPPQRMVDVFVTFAISSANIFAFAWLVRHYATPLVATKGTPRRSFSDWFFDTVQSAINRLHQLPFVSH